MRHHLPFWARRSWIIALTRCARRPNWTRTGFNMRHIKCGDAIRVRPRTLHQASSQLPLKRLSAPTRCHASTYENHCSSFLFLRFQVLFLHERRVYVRRRIVGPVKMGMSNLLPCITGPVPVCGQAKSNEM